MQFLVDFVLILTLVSEIAAAAKFPAENRMVNKAAEGGISLPLDSCSEGQSNIYISFSRKLGRKALFTESRYLVSLVFGCVQ